VHALNALPSSEHRKPTPLSLSLKLKLALDELVGLNGPEVIAGGGGGVVSLVHG
jgi:hypothetical protein